MNRQQLKNFNDSILHLISTRRLHAAFSVMRQLLDTVIASWEMREELARLREAYTYMAQYALDGTTDPHRDDVYNDIVNGLLDLLARVSRDVKTIDDSSLYYSILRYENMRNADSITSIADSLKQQASIMRMAELSGNTKADINRMRSEYEQTERRLFNRVWTTFPLRSADEESLLPMLTDDLTETSTSALMVSALLLQLLTYYDERALTMLLHTYYSATDDGLRMRSLTALLIALSIHRNRRQGKRFTQLLATVADTPDWSTDVRTVFLQFIRTRDTEKITRKVTDEVIPEMLKLRPDIYRKISRDAEENIDPTSPDENPEWEEILEKSGVADKMRELQEMQEEGADIMMSTFGQLKTFPFFNDVANWFLPFRPTHTQIADQGGSRNGIMAMLGGSTFLCNSDRYSVALSISRMPQSQRDMLMRQFEAQRQQIQEELDTSLPSPTVDRATEVRNYVQDLYRFFKLFRRKGEFTDPFATSLNLVTLRQLDSVFENPEQLDMIAEFYFKRGYYEDAFLLFERLDREGVSSAAMYQKMGYCRQQLGDKQGALDLYLKADMLSRDDKWTLRRIATVYRLLGHPAEALDYYLRLAKKKPDDLGLALHIGHCYMELGKYTEALSQYFKVEYLDPDSHRALRPIAWCSFLARDYDRSRDYYSRIPADTLTSGDWLNMGHLEMATAHYREALNNYRRALDALGGDRSKFSSSLQADLTYLRSAGVEDFITGIVLDKLLADN